MSPNDSARVRELELDLTSEDETTRGRALLELARIRRDLQLLEWLKKMAAEDPSVRIRSLAKKLYAEVKATLAQQIKDQVSIVATDGGIDPVTLYASLNSEEVEIRLEALRQVQEEKDKRALIVCLKALSRETDAYVIATLVKCVGLLGDSTHIGTLQPFLKHADARVAANTIEALEMIGGDLVVPILVPMLGHADQRVEANAVKALVRFDRGQALAALERMAQSQTEATRESALYCLGLVEGPEAEGILVKMFVQESVPDLVKKQAKTLARVGTKACLPTVSRLLKATQREKAEAARDVQKGVSARLGIAIEEVVDIEIAAHKEIERARQSALAARTVRSRPVMRPPTTHEHVWAWVREHRARAAVAAVVLAAITAWPLLPERPEPELVPAVSAPAIVMRASAAADFKEYKGRTVTLTGRVRIQERPGQTLLLYCGHRPVLARRPRPAQGGASPQPEPAQTLVGRLVTVTGTLAARTHLGALVVDATSVEAAR